MGISYYEDRQYLIEFSNVAAFKKCNTSNDGYLHPATIILKEPPGEKIKLYTKTNEDAEKKRQSLKFSKEYKAYINRKIKAKK